MASAAPPAVGRVESLLDGLDALPDPAARDAATEVVQALLELYGDALGRIVDAVGEDAARELAHDELVAHLLMLHDLHPLPAEARVRQALDEVRPYLESHGGDVELLAVEDGVAHLRLQGSCKGCPSSAATLRLAIEEAIQKLAPDIERVEADGAVEAAPAPGVLTIEVTPAARRTWSAAGALSGLDDGPMLEEVGGEQVLFARLDGRLVAYRPACPGCGRALAAGDVRGRHLDCPGCERRFDLRLAGRCAEAPGLHLDPVPLLADGASGWKVALG
jgi:Fe-S cluster biogenesis protein NfuA